MKIISKFRDYYDSASAFGVDETRVYLRTEKEVDSKLLDKRVITALNKIPKLSIFEHRDTGFNCTAFVLGYCGNLYTGISITFPKPLKHSTKENEEVIKHFFDIESLDAFFKSEFPRFYEKKWVVKKSSREIIAMDAWSYSRNQFTAQIFKDRFALNAGGNFDDISHKLKAPVFYYGGTDKRLDDKWKLDKRSLIINPCLKDLDFARVVDSFSCHQNIDQYLFGVLALNNKEPLEIADKYKVEGKGFDQKYGFRTRPADKKN